MKDGNVNGMIKKRIAAALTAFVTAAAVSGCGAKKTGETTSSLADDSSTAAVSSQADSESSSVGETSSMVEENAKEEVSPVIKYMKRAEENARAVGGDVTEPPAGSGQLNLLLAMDSHTNYVRAAEDYIAAGGKIKVIKTPRDALFDQISAETVAGKRIDIAQFDNGMMFPYGVTQELIQPTDLAIDYTAARWKKYEELSGAFEMNGWHYAVIFGRSAKNVLYYNKKTLSANGFSDPVKLYDSGDWSLETFCNMLRKWKERGGKCGVAGHDYEEGLCIGTGRALITYDRACTGFSNNFYDPSICAAMNYIYGLKYDGIVGDTTASDIAGAFNEGTLFWSGSYEEGKAYSGSDLGAVTFPTLTGEKSSRCWDAEYDGLVLLKGTEDMAAVRAFFECAREQEHGLTGSLAKTFTPGGLPIYEYGMGISPMVSDSLSGANAGYDKAIIPLMYTEGPDYGDWDNVMCYTFSREIHRELADINNAIADKVFGRSKEKETKKTKKKKTENTEPD